VYWSSVQEEGLVVVVAVHDVGQRVSVRRRVEGGLTDVVGHLLDASDARLSVLRKDGEVVDLDRAAVTAAKVVPPAPVRPGWQVPEVSPDAMQRICWAGWPAAEHEMLGDWALRAHDGITGRANSAMAVGDPGRPLPEALDAVRDWYAARGLPALLQLPLADPANQDMADAGWERLHVTIVQVAPIAPVLASIPARDDLRASVEPEPSTAWRSLMHDLDTEHPDRHLEILTGPARVGFATLYRGDQPVGIGRVSVEGDWAGVTSVDVDPSARRQGIGSAVMGALLTWAQEQGASSTYLQVRAANPAALRLYAALGYVTHHPYNYRAPVAG
jgi:ribosomal protein S18 acetylase RimI-like enzyme